MQEKIGWLLLGGCMTSKNVYVEQKQAVLDAIQIANSGDLESALETLNNILSEETNNHFVRLNVANLYLLLGQLEHAEKNVDDFIDSESGSYLDFYLQAISIYSQLACLKKAIKVARRITNIFPKSLETWWSLAETAFDSRSKNDGEFAAFEFLKRAPKQLEMKVYLANLLSGKGEFKKAESLYMEVISANPAHSIALHGLSKCRKFNENSHFYIKITNDALKLLETSNSNNHVNESEDYARIMFSQAKFYNDAENYDSAWDSAVLANDKLNKIIPYDKNEFSRYTDELISKFKNYKMVENKKYTTEHSPILIVGMPRSGTTLIEQIMSMDENVYAGGEKQGLDYSLAKTFGKGDYLTQFLSASEDDLRIMAENYHSYYQQFENYKGIRVVDKVPRNYLHLGIFVKLFPNVKIINMVRNKMDNVTSIYFEHFSNRINYTNNIADILHARGEYEKLMKFWNEILPGNILTVNYEDLVEDFDVWKNKIIKFCKLDIDKNSQFADSKNMVETPSVWQVRQGINTNSIGRWKRYEKHLKQYM
ncbi:MAG: tetratricopeptide (TPR) repeat protein [Polaribacter sp.]|jgi:tetratricopeptide (TPR) repeat protein